MIDAQLDLIKRRTVQFLDGIRRADVAVIASCYTADAVYSDPMFGDLPPGQAHLFWAFLLAHTHRFALSYVIDDVGLVSARASSAVIYELLSTARPVEMRLQSSLFFRDDLIVRHDDEFDPASWRQIEPGPVACMIAQFPSWRSRLCHETNLRMRHYIGQKASFST